MDGMRQKSMFEKKSGEDSASRAPLAERMRPGKADEFVGQSHLLGRNRVLDRLLREGQPRSLILWGPPGCGKTTLAKIVATHMDTRVIALSAVTAGTREIRSSVEEAQSIWTKEKKRTWLFMDEIHRLNKAQQDTLLPHVENGTLLLLGATTENPSFEVIRPLLSRCQVLVLEPLGTEELRTIVHRAIEDEEKGLGKCHVRIDSDAEESLIALCGGDARVILNTLEAAVLTTAPAEDGIRTIDMKTIGEVVQRQAVHYDKAGEEHFNLISALHKSVRGSDPDAALYWLARMLEAGEDPLYLARRLIRMATEDVGLADPFALMEAIAAFHAYQFLGTPEGELALAQVVVYLALAQKSNSVYTSFGAARELARRTGDAPVPFHLRNAPTSLMKQMGYGKMYRYPHDFPEGWVAETYLPETLTDSIFFNPTSRGWEGRKQDLLARRRSEIAKRGKSS